MAKYSSDSDSDRSSRYRKKHYRRSRSASSSSSEDSSSYQKKKTTTSTKHSKSKRRHRSRSRSREKDRSSRSHKSSRVSSRERDVRRRYQTLRKSRSSSPDGDKKKYRSVSREKSSSRSSSSQSNVKTLGALDKGQNSANKDDFIVETRVKDQSIIDEINSERFVPKHFSSSSSQNKQLNKTNNIVIDITADTIKIPAAVVNLADNSSDSIFHTSITSDGDARFDKWVKKLYTLRQKAITDLTSNSNSMS